MPTRIFDSAEEAFDNFPKRRVPKLDAGFELVDILQLITHGGKKLALVSMTNGFAWFRLSEVRSAEPELWSGYVTWYREKYDVHPLTQLDDGMPSPPRFPAQNSSVPGNSTADHDQLLPASPYGSADITSVYAAAILSRNLSALKPDWLAFLGSTGCRKIHQQLEVKVRLIPFWQIFKMLAVRKRLKNFVSLAEQRTLLRGWYTWRLRAEKATSNRSMQSVIHLSLAQSVFSTLRNSAQLVRRSMFMRASLQQMYVLKAFSQWRLQTDDVADLERISLEHRLLRLKRSFDLIRVYAAGAAGHIQAVNSLILFKTFSIWRDYSGQCVRLSRVIAACNLSVVELAYQAWCRATVDRWHDDSLMQAGIDFCLLRGFSSWKSHRSVAVQHKLSSDVGCSHFLKSSFHIWKQSAIELASASHNLTVATGWFLARALVPEWSFFSAHSSPGWLRSLSVSSFVDLWEDRRLCFLPFLKWLSLSRSVGDGTTVGLPIASLEDEISANVIGAQAVPTIPSLPCALPITMMPLLPFWKLWRRSFGEALGACTRLETVSYHMIKRFFRAWSLFVVSQQQLRTSFVTAIAARRVSLLSTAYGTLSVQTLLSMDAADSIQSAVTYLLRRAFGAFCLQCVELGDSAYSENSAVVFRNSLLCKLGFAKLAGNLVSTKMLAGAALSFQSSSVVRGFDTLRTRAYWGHVGAGLFHRALLFRKRRWLAYLASQHRCSAILRSHMMMASQIFCQSCLMLGWISFTNAVVKCQLDQEVNNKVVLPLKSCWSLSEAFRLLAANARWFSFAVNRHSGLCLDWWREVTALEMAALKSVRRASPSLTADWAVLIQKNSVSAAYSKLSKFWVRLNDKRWLSMKFLHMVSLCRARFRAACMLFAFEAWHDFDSENPPDLHLSSPVIDAFAAFRPTRSEALKRVLSDATLKAAPGSAVIPPSHVLSPTTSWPVNLKHHVDLVLLFQKLSSPLASCPDKEQLALLSMAPAIPSEMLVVLQNPARLWSCSLTREEFLMADNVERQQHYSFVWLIPLWMSHHSDDRQSFMFWNCHSASQVEMDFSSYLTSGRQIAESELLDVVLAFEGASFVEPLFVLPVDFNVLDRRSIKGEAAEVAVSVSAAAGCTSPSPVAQNLSDLAALARAEAEANLRSPFLTKDSVRPSDPAPQHVSEPVPLSEHADHAFVPGSLVQLSTDMSIKGAVVEAVPPSSMRVLWFRSGVQQVVSVRDLALITEDLDKSVSTLSPCLSRDPLLIAREACKAWQPTSVVEDTLTTIQSLVNRLPCCRQLNSEKKCAITVLILEHLCSWSSRVPDTTPFGCVSGSVLQWAIEMESKPSFECWIQKKLVQLTAVPIPAASLVGGSELFSPAAADVPSGCDNPLVCYNPSCNELVDPAAEACRACNFPAANMDFYCFCNRRCDPRKKFCHCKLPLLHHLKEDAQLALIQSQQSKSSSLASLAFVGRSPTFKAKIIYTDEELRMFSNMRHGQTPSKLYGSVEMSPQEMFLKLVDTPLGSTRRNTGGINKFKIAFTHRLYYLTTKSMLGGDVSYGLQGWEFARVVIGVMECPKFDAALNYRQPEVPHYKNGSSFLDVDTWIAQWHCLADWYAELMQAAFAQEVKAVVDHLAWIYSMSLVEESEITLLEIDNTLCSVLTEFRNEHLLYISSPSRHLDRYPDSIILQLGEVRRPKLWIVDDVGEERASFKMSFRELRRLAAVQKLDKVAKQVELLQQRRARVDKHGGESDAQTAFAEAWKGLKEPVGVDKSLVSADDWRIAKEHYAALCENLDDGVFKDCKSLCWKHSSRVGCNKKGPKCSMSHSGHIPKALASRFLSGQLVMACFGGFANMPAEYDPQQVTATIQSLREKIAADLPSAPKVGGPNSLSDACVRSPDVPPSLESLLLVRPAITLGSWDHSVPSIVLGGETIPILCSRSWSCHFPGALSSTGLYFAGTEFNAGEHLAGESMKCFMLAQGAAHGVSPSRLLRGYRRDAEICQAKLPPGSNSLVKMHLDFFQMSHYENLPRNVEICEDLLQLDQPLSYHCMQILEQSDLAGKVTIIIEVGRSTESDKVLRASIRFVVLISKSASEDAPVAVLKAEKLHCTWIADFQYSYDSISWVSVDVFQRFLEVRKVLETTTQVALKLCCNVQDTLSQFEGIAWPEYLPSAAIPVGELPDWHSLGVSSDVDYDLLLIPFHCATALNNPSRRPLVELRFAVCDNLLTLAALAKAGAWDKFDLTNCNCSSFPVDNSAKLDYNVWSQDVVDLKADDEWFSAYLRSFDLILLSWGFHSDGSACNSSESAGVWNGNVARLYHMARSAWLFGCSKQLLALQLVARLVSATACHSPSGFDHSVLLRFTICDPVKNGSASGCPLPLVDVKLLTAAKELHALTRAGIADPGKYASCMEWFRAYVIHVADLTVAVDEKFDGDYLAMFVRFTRMFHPGCANNFADPVRVAEKLILSDVNLEHYIGKRLVRIHRTGVPVELLGKRSFSEKTTNLPEAEQYCDLTLKACRKLTVSGMMILWPESVLHIVKNWEILVSPMGIVFTDKKPVSAGGRIIQACSANMRGDALNWLTAGDHDWLPCVYDGSTAAAKAYFAADDQLKACIEAVKEGESPLVIAALQNFVGLTYVDDNHGLGHDGSSVVGAGSDGCHAFSTNSQDEDSVGAVSVHLKVEQKWQDVFGASVIGGYTSDNFGWRGSPAQYQPIALSIKAGVQGSNPASVAALLPGYEFKVEDRPLLMLHALLTHMRYVIGYEGKIDFAKTQEVTSDLERLGCVLHLSKGEISVSVPHLEKAIAVLSEVFTFKSENYAGIPLRWLQRATSHVRFAGCYPRSWMTGFLAMFVRCVSGVHSDALPDHLCSPAMPHQTLEEGMDSFYRCCTTLLVLLVSIRKKPTLGRVPLFMLLPPQEAIFRAEWSSLGFSGQDACDDGFSTMLFEPNADNKIEVLLMTWPSGVLELLQKMRDASLREHDRDFLTMGNLEHFAILANNLQWASSRFYGRLIFHITDSVNAKGCVNRSFSPNFVDQEMRRLASWLKVLYSWSETATWVNTWMNLFNDLLSRLFHNGCLKGQVLEQIHDFAHSRGFNIEFVKPSANVEIAMRWLADQGKGNLSLVQLFEHLYAGSVDSDIELSLVKDVSDCVAAASVQKLGSRVRRKSTAGFRSWFSPLSLDQAGCCMTSVVDLRQLALYKISNFASNPVMTSSNLCCGMGGFTIGGMLAGFLPVQNKDIAGSAAKFHKFLTGGFAARGDLKTLKASRLLATHLLTIGFPCQNYSVMGNQEYNEGKHCLVKWGVELVLHSGAVMVLAECVPALRTAKGGAVWRFIVEMLSPQYFLADATLLLKYFDHSTNRCRFFFVGANKDFFESNPFGKFPSGHLKLDSDVPPMSRAMQDPDSVPIRHHRYVEVVPVPAPITPVRGFLTRVSRVAASKFKGSPLFPNFENNTDGLASTMLSSAYVCDSDRAYAENPPPDLPAAYKESLLSDLSRGSFGVNTGLYSRTLASGDKVLSTLTPVEQSNLANFPADACAVATQLGLTDDEISCGVNGAVPVTAAFTLSSWLMHLLRAHDIPVVLPQKSSRPYHCGVSTVQEFLSGGESGNKMGGSGVFMADLSKPAADPFSALFELEDLGNLFLVSRSPVVAGIVKGQLLPLLLPGVPLIKMGADRQSTYGFSNPRHPVLGGKRKLLTQVPTAEEIADEDEFQAAAFASSLAPSSQVKYAGAMRDFTQYLGRFSIVIDYDLPKDELINFLRKWIRRFLLNEGGVRGLAYSAINAKSYGIRWHFLVSHEIDVLEGWLQHKVFMRGVKRLRHHPKRKLPVSWSLLLLTVNSLDLASSRHLVIAAGLLLGWFFGTRVSELVGFRLCSIVLFDAQGVALSFTDPHLVDLAVEVEVRFGVTKSDQDGEGAVRSHYCTNHVLCCVRTLASMLVARVAAGAPMNPDAPLFLFFGASAPDVEGDRLSRAIIARILKAGAAAAGIPSARVSCHSLRSGGATAMLRAGRSYEDVRCFFRWRSDVARIYLRSIRGAMRDVSVLMASGSGMGAVMLAGN